MIFFPPLGKMGLSEINGIIGEARDILIFLGWFSESVLGKGIRKKRKERGLEKEQKVVYYLRYSNPIKDTTMMNQCLWPTGQKIIYHKFSNKISLKLQYNDKITCFHTFSPLHLYIKWWCKKESIFCAGPIY